MAKWWSDGDRAGMLEPADDTAIRVDSEDLAFVVAPDLSRADVTATYRLTNGPEAADVEVAFVVVHGDGASGIESASVTIDGERIPTGIDRQGRQERWSTLGEPRKLAWITFRLAMAPSASRTVQVHYTQAAGSNMRTAANTVFTYDYLLSPAKHWARFGPLHLRVELPPETELRSSSVPLDANGRADLPSLPGGELTFEVMSRKGLILGMTKPRNYWLLLALVLALVTIPSARWLGRRLPRGLAHLAVGAAAGAWNGALLAVVTPRFPPFALGFGYDVLSGTFAMIVLFSVIAMAVSTHSAPRRS